jgi:hypothetical protein
MRCTSLRHNTQYWHDEQILQHLKKKVDEAGKFRDERLQHLNEMEATVPYWALDELEKGIRSNEEYLKSKFTKSDETEITLQLIASFNYYLSAAIHNYELADHLYETNMIDVHYYSNIQFSISQRKALADNRFTKFKDRDIIFKIFPGLGSLLSSRIHLVQVPAPAMVHLEAGHLHRSVFLRVHRRSADVCGHKRTHNDAVAVEHSLLRPGLHAVPSGRTDIRLHGAGECVQHIRDKDPRLLRLLHRQVRPGDLPELHLLLLQARVPAVLHHPVHLSRWFERAQQDQLLRGRLG